MNDESLLGALASRSDPSALMELEQRVLALQCNYKQRQSDLVEQFQRSQQELAASHIAESQNLLEEFLKERSAHAPVLRHSSLPTMSPLPRASSIETAASSGSPAGHSPCTISDRTKEKLKAFIYSKRRRQLSSGDEICHHYSPYPRTSSDFHQLRKVRSEPDLDSQLAGLRSRLPEAVLSSDVSTSRSLASPCCRDFPSLLANNSGSLTFPAPSLPCLPLYFSRSTDNLNRSDATGVPPFSSFLRNSSLFLSTPSLVSASSSSGCNPTSNYLSPFSSFLGPGGMLMSTDLPNATYLSPSFYGSGLLAPFDATASSFLPPMEQYQYNVLRQQLRDLVLRRKSLVREETDDEVAREGLGTPLPKSLACLGISENAEASKTTGVVFDLSMARHECICPIKVQHIENGERIKAIWSYLQKTNILDKCKKISGRKTPLEYIRLCHGECYTTFFGVSPTACMKSDPTRMPLRGFVQLLCGGIGVDEDTYFNDGETQLSARMAVGCTVDLCLAVANGSTENGFAIVRPPGHMAEPNQAAAFCFFNNVAIAAHALLQKKSNVKKIAIVDWDVHHGKGLQQIFEADPRVLYLSLHRHDHGLFYPGSGAADEIGRDEGVGYTVNIPWYGDSMGDAEYLAAFRYVVLPVLDQFQPDFIIVAAGFDAADGHSPIIGGYKLSPALFAYMTNALMSYAGGKVVLVLEGGYDVPIVCQCVEQCLRALCHDQIVSLSEESLSKPPCNSAKQALKRVLSIQQKYWPKINAAVDLNTSQNECDEQIDDV
ncbi:histone deacetylase 4 [Trichuris trichiura]|uniref:histone deacetylase n=1 Tax=Trichuris trichiura TaxID=36087 RepID=A0A077YYM2_TRITR|nr:histone deacetylase 4 [Trichuris trichiura]